MQGKFLSVEGVEGVGKTTNMAFVKQYLERKGIGFITTREPGGTPLAEDIRTLLLQTRDEVVDPTAELLLVFAARAQHFNTCIKPALKKGLWVLSDRFVDATYAYQGAGRGLSLDDIRTLEHLVLQGCLPDKTLYLDIDVTVGLERAKQRGELDRFEQENIDFFEKVRSMYLMRAKEDAKRFAVIDASQTLEHVQDDILSVLESFR